MAMTPQTRVRTVRKVIGTTSPIASIMSMYRSQSPAQLRKAAHSSVMDDINASIAANNAGISTQNALLDRQAKRAQGFASALGTLTKPDPSAVLAQYREAADRMSAYGTGLTGAVADAQTKANETANQNVHGLLGEGAPAVAGYDPAAIRNAATMTGVVIPGSELEQRALDAAARASYGRAASVSNVGQIAQEYLQKQDDLQNEIAGKNAALQAQRPILERQALAELQKGQRQDLATMLSAAGLLNTTESTKSLINYRKAQTQVVKEKNKPGVFSATNSNSTGYKTDTLGNPIRVGGSLVPMPGYKIAKDGSRAVKIPGGKAGSKGAATHLQSKTYNGNIVLFDPVAKTFYLPGDTKNAIDPNSLLPKDVKTPDEMRQLRAKAQQGIDFKLNDPKTGDPDTDPKVIYTAGIANNVPGWTMLQALRAEALNPNHKDDKAWQAVLKAGWVSGSPPKKRKKR